MARFTPRKKTSRSSRAMRKGGDLQRLHIKVSSPRIVMFQFLKELGRLAKLAVILGLISLICWGGYRGIEHVFLGNERYILQEIELKTNGKLSHTRVVEAANIDLGANVFAINIDQLKESLTKLPEVISCDVERRLPGKLRITLMERVPIAWIESQTLNFPGRKSGGILVDSKGITFPCESCLWNSAQDLPVIVVHGAEEENFLHGHAMKQPDIIRAIHLLKSFQNANIRAEWLPERIVLLNSYSMEAMCNDGSYAVFGMYEHERQINDFISVREHIIKSDRQVQHINLIPKINIPVKFADAGTIEVSPHLGPVLVNPNTPQDSGEIQSILRQN